MSAFSNTDTGSKPADPYTAANKEGDLPVSEKIETLDKFVSSCKFGMMTTRDTTTGKLVSRCMAIAAKVRLRLTPKMFHAFKLTQFRKTGASTSSSSRTRNPKRPTNW